MKPETLTVIIDQPHTHAGHVCEIGEAVAMPADSAAWCVEHGRAHYADAEPEKKTKKGGKA